jgi:FkbM family methyltransferase
MAPAEFKAVLHALVCDYRSDDIASVSWIVIHKGRRDALEAVARGRVAQDWSAVFGNEVFVVLSRRTDLPSESSESPHIRSFRDAVGAAMRKGGGPHVLGWKHHTREVGRRLSRMFGPREEATHRPELASSRPAVYIGDYRVLTRTVYGDKLFIDSRDIDLAPHLILDGYWERWVTQTFLGLLAEGMTVVEVGANIGYYSVLAARHIGPYGRLYCFEANPEMADLLRANLEINGYADRVKIINRAVYCKSAKVPFHCFQKHRGGSSIWIDETRVRDGALDSIYTIETEAIALDDFFVPGTRVDVLKTDAEGADLHILEGARRLLSDNPGVKIVMEVNGPQLQRALSHEDPSHEDPYEVLWRTVHGMGFAIDLINHDGSVERASVDRLRTLKISDVLLTSGRRREGASHRVL